MRRPRRQLCGGIAAGPISDPVSGTDDEAFLQPWFPRRALARRLSICGQDSRTKICDLDSRPGFAAEIRVRPSESTADSRFGAIARLARGLK